MSMLKVVNKFRKSIESMRKELIEVIKTYLNPREQDTYVNLFVPYCSGIKYADNEGNLGLYAQMTGELHPMCLEDMPVESLIELLNQLQQTKLRKTV